LLAAVLGAVSPPLAASPAAATLAGRVADSSGTPIAGARIEVLELRRVALTDDDGRYRLGSLPSGTFSVSVGAIGFRPVLRTVTLRDSVSTLDIVLVPTPIQLTGIQVTASPDGSSSLHSPQPVSVADAEALTASQAATVGAAIEALAGVRSLSTGSGIGKPVIRGLTSNRVLVLDDGQRVESQDWGDEHGPQVEIGGAERIEVVRGPASVLYGSDALGGVVNVVQRPMPDAIGRAPYARGRAGALHATNGNQHSGTLALEGARGGLGARAGLTALGVRDAATPAGALFNSGVGTLSGTAGAAYAGTFGSIHAMYSGRGERVEIHEDPRLDPAATPYQRIGDRRLHLEASLALGRSHLDLVGGYQRNDRREFESDAAPDPVLRLTATSWIGEARWHHADIGPVGGVIGVSGQRSALVKSGAESLVPSNAYATVGAFVFEQMDLGRWSVTAGLRFDSRRLDVDDDTALAVIAQRRTYTSVTGALGVLARISEQAALVLNVGRGYRAPNAFELFANGVHEGTARFERGDPALTNEVSLNADAGVRIQGRRLSAEFSAFRNAIDGYIYPDPTAQIDSGSGFQVFDFRQGDARLVGVEASVEWYPVTRLRLRAGGDAVRGQNLTLGQPLPFVPPFRVTYGARVALSGQGPLRTPWLSVDGEANARQTRLEPQDYAPPGYALVRLGAGSDVALGRGTVTVSINLLNALNARYTRFLSRYKRYALDPGRSLVLRVETTF
jgi:iron complex outermembrane receptor protein